MHFQWTFSTWKEETTKNNARDNERFHAPGMNRARDSPNTIKIGPFNHWTRGSRVRFTQSQFVEKNKQNGGSKVSDADWLYFSFHDLRWFFLLIRVQFYFIFIFFIPSWLVWVDPSWSDPDWRSELIRSDFCTCLLYSLQVPEPVFHTPQEVLPSNWKRCLKHFCEKIYNHMDILLRNSQQDIQQKSAFSTPL